MKFCSFNLIQVPLLLTMAPLKSSVQLKLLDLLMQNLFAGDITGI